MSFSGTRHTVPATLGTCQCIDSVAEPILLVLCGWSFSLDSR
jgi:hypothetical protein